MTESNRVSPLNDVSANDLAHTSMNAHQFEMVRVHAKQLVAWDPSNAYRWRMTDYLSSTTGLKDLMIWDHEDRNSLVAVTMSYPNIHTAVAMAVDDIPRTMKFIPASALKSTPEQIDSTVRSHSNVVSSTAVLRYKIGHLTLWLDKSTYYLVDDEGLKRYRIIK